MPSPCCLSLAKTSYCQIVMILHEKKRIVLRMPFFRLYFCDVRRNGLRRDIWWRFWQLFSHTLEEEEEEEEVMLDVVTIQIPIITFILTQLVLSWSQLGSVVIGQRKTAFYVPRVRHTLLGGTAWRAAVITPQQVTCSLLSPVQSCVQDHVV